MDRLVIRRHRQGCRDAVDGRTPPGEHELVEGDGRCGRGINFRDDQVAGMVDGGDLSVARWDSHKPGVPTCLRDGIREDGQAAAHAGCQVGDLDGAGQELTGGGGASGVAVGLSCEDHASVRRGRW